MVLLLLLLGAGAVAPESGRQQQLDRIRSEIESLAGALGEVEARAGDLSSELHVTSIELQLQEARVAEAVAEHAVAEAEFAQAHSEVVALEERLALVRRALGRRLAALYRLGGQGYLRLLLTFDRQRDALGALRQLRYRIRSDAQALEGYRERRRELESRREALLHRQREVQSWVDAEVARRQDLDRALEQKRSVLARLEAERGSLAARAELLERKEERLGHLLALLGGGDQVELAGTPIQDFRGALDWPLAGTVTTPFGPRLDPRYGTRVPNNGIELEVHPGADVQVIYPGRVIFAAPFQGYGFTAVVQHPARVLTLYAGLSRLLVERGAMLDLGDSVGQAESRLYFEIRVDNVPEDPADWLR